MGHHGNTFLSFGVPAAAAIGGWVELGRTILGASSDTITVSDLPNKRYYKVLQHVLHSGSAPDATRLGNSTADAGTNYATRYSENGGSENLFTSINRCIDYTPTVSGDESFAISYLSNLSAQEKLMIKHRVGRQAAGAATAPNRSENVAKWANVSNSLDIFQDVNVDTGDYLSGSEIVVLGWDPADTHTTNFWEELFSGTGTSLDTGVAGITAKKYLWIQTKLSSPITSGQNHGFVFNGDTANNYSTRFQLNGSADGTDVSRGDFLIPFQGQTGETSIFANTFIINNSSKEKLGINHVVWVSTAGAANAPNRQEQVSKWVNTSAQITDVQVLGNYGTGSKMKIWGSN